jgi:hypothetical protein
MRHDELTPLLLMREELQPKPSRMATLYVQQTRTTIVHLPFYNEAGKGFTQRRRHITLPPLLMYAPKFFQHLLKPFTGLDPHAHWSSQHR